MSERAAKNHPRYVHFSSVTFFPEATRTGRAIVADHKALQHLLTRSFSGRALAVRRVTENQGKRTPGVDGVVWDSPKKKIEAVLTLRQRGYQTLPLRRIYIPKNNGGGQRPLSIPMVRSYCTSIQ
jgi:retron-type reverse transcriptase